VLGIHAPTGGTPNVALRSKGFGAGAPSAVRRLAILFRPNPSANNSKMRTTTAASTGSTC
jgi:hypothetical protein